MCDTPAIADMKAEYLSELERSAPIISSYCVASVIWGRIFLKEKLSKKHYACIALVVAGIIIMGILDI